MAHVEIIDNTTLRITLRLEDATTMVQIAQREQAEYAQEIVTIYEKCLCSNILTSVFTPMTVQDFLSVCSAWTPKPICPSPSMRRSHSSTRCTVEWPPCMNHLCSWYNRRM